MREVPLSPQSLRVLEDVIAAGRERNGGGFWTRLAASVSFDRNFVADRAALARAALSRGICAEVSVRHAAPPAISEHEHGVFVFAEAGPSASLLLDLSSVSDDPRWPLCREGGLMRTQWHWLRFRDFGGTWCFTAAGPAIVPRNIGFFHGTALERRLTEGMDWPGDDSVIPLPIAEIERLAKQKH